MKPLIIGVHGFNTDGEYIKELAIYFNNAGYEYWPFIYGRVWIGFLGNMIVNRIRTKSVLAKLLSIIDVLQKPVVLVGHSNGVMLSWLASEECKNVTGVICLNGALDEDTEFKPWVINCFHPDDWILDLAKHRVFSKWGRYGTVPSDSAEININLRNYFRSWNPHSKMFKKENLNNVMPRTIKAMGTLLK